MLLREGRETSISKNHEYILAEN